MQPSPADRDYRTGIIIWAAMVVAIVMYFVVMRMVTPQASTSDSTLVTIFLFIALSLVAASLFIKKALPARAATIVPMVLCDAAGVMGLVSWFVTGSTKSYYALAIGLAGMFLNFPTRKETL